MASVRYCTVHGVIEVSPESRGGQIHAEVMETRGGLWEAYDQGRMAYAMGEPFTTSPHLSWHVNNSDWERGWRAEEKRALETQLTELLDSHRALRTGSLAAAREAVSPWRNPPRRKMGV